MRTVADVMTRDVITTTPRTPIREVARLLVEHGISGLPVVDDDGAVVGMLSEGDLIVRQRPRAPASWWYLLFRDGERLARDYRKRTGTTAAEVMSTKVIHVTPETPIEWVAALLHGHRIRRLPVLEQGRLVGIVSRGDLVRALATSSMSTVARSDVELVAEMKRRMAREAWISRRGLLVEARAGTLTLVGLVESDAEHDALETMARAIPGCRSVDNQTISRSRIIARYGAA